MRNWVWTQQCGKQGLDTTPVGLRRGPAGQRADAPSRRRRCEGLRRAVRGQAAVPVGGGGAWPDNEPTHQAGAAGVKGAGGTGGAWPQCPWVAAGPGQASSRRARPHTSNQASPVWRAPGGPEGPGRSARGRWRGLAGLRDDAPSRRLAARTTRGRAAAHGHTKQPGPTEQDARRPKHQRHHKNHCTTWGARARRPAPLDATTQTLRSTCVPFRSAHAAHRSRRSSRSPRLRRRAGPRR